MSKVIKSPVDHFAGEVTLSDPLTFPQVFAIEDAMDASRELGDDASQKRRFYAVLPGIFKCVEKWDLVAPFPASVTVETFPSTPSISSAQVIAWLMGEITDLFDEADPDPNA